MYGVAIGGHDFFFGTETGLTETHSSYIIGLSDLSKIKWAHITFYLDKRGVTIYTIPRNQE